VTALTDTPTRVAPDGKPGFPVPRDIQDRVRRGRDAMRKDAALRRVCQKFWEGDHYWYVNTQGMLRMLSTALVDVTGGKPAHRIRNTYNFIGMIVEGKISASTQKMPGYEVNPSSADWEDWAAARISEQVAVFGYDKWWLRRARTKVYTNAFVQREGFALPYFDAGIGPFTEGPDGRMVGQGEVRVWTGTRSEVMWEPDQDFMESRWHAIERAMPIEDIQRIPGYIGGEIVPNATTADLPSEKRSEKMAALTDYLERPSSKYPLGRRCFINGGRIVVDFRMDPQCPPDWTDWWEQYPYMDANGVVADEPVIHRLSYTVNPDGDDLGLVERLIDLMRTINDCWNKLLEWKNRCLMPRKMAPKGAKLTPSNDVPGGVDYYDLVIDPSSGGAAKPEWEPTLPIPRELFDLLNMAVEQMRALASDIDVQPDPNLAAKTANVAVGQAQSRWDSFLGDAEEFDSRLMRHCLCLVARYYTEERIIDIRGRYGWEPPTTFTGVDLRSQVNVRVMPGSLVSKSRAQIMQEVEFVNTIAPGSISAEVALAALHGGTAENLLRSYTLDIAMANNLVQRLQKGPQAMAEFGWRLDMDFGDPALGYLVPGWMPRKVDNVAIWKQVVGDFMKTDLYNRQLPMETQHMFDTVYEGLEHQEQQRKMQIVMQEQGMAAQLGGMNAARPQAPAALASPSPLRADQAAPAALTPKQ
jgi:hypothetical protein